MKWLIAILLLVGAVESMLIATSSLVDQRSWWTTFFFLLILAFVGATLPVIFPSRSGDKNNEHPKIGSEFLDDYDDHGGLV